MVSQVPCYTIHNSIFLGVISSRMCMWLYATQHQLPSRLGVIFWSTTQPRVLEERCSSKLSNGSRVRKIPQKFFIIWKIGQHVYHPPTQSFWYISWAFPGSRYRKVWVCVFFLKEKKLGRKIPLVVCARKSWEFSVRELLKVWESERETFWSSPSKLRRSLCLLGPDQSGVGEKFNKRITRIRRVPTQKINDTVATFWANTWGIEFLRGTVGTTLLRGPLNPTPSVLGKIIKIKKLARGERRPAFLRFSWAQCEIDGLQSCSARKSI